MVSWIYLCTRYTSFLSVQLLSCVRLFVTPRTAARQAFLFMTNSQSLLKFMSTELLDHLILCSFLLLLPLIFPSIRIFSKKSALCIKWPEYWSFSFSISPSNGYSGLISLKTDCLDLLAFQGILKSSPTPQAKNINFLVLSFLYSPTLTFVNDYWQDDSFN